MDAVPESMEIVYSTYGDFQCAEYFIIKTRVSMRCIPEIVLKTQHKIHGSRGTHMSFY